MLQEWKKFKHTQYRTLRNQHSAKLVAVLCVWAWECAWCMSERSCTCLSDYTLEIKCVRAMNQTKRTLWQVTVMQRDSDSFCRLPRRSAWHFPWREFKVAGWQICLFFFCSTTPLMPASYKLCLFMHNHNYPPPPPFF